MQTDPDDPKGLVREAYRIEGIGPAECRSIFIDWALSLPVGADTGAALASLIARHAEAPDHPMTEVLREASRAAPRRRGGGAGAPGVTPPSDRQPGPQPAPAPPAPRPRPSARTP